MAKLSKDKRIALAFISASVVLALAVALFVRQGQETGEGNKEGAPETALATPDANPSGSENGQGEAETEAAESSEAPKATSVASAPPAEPSVQADIPSLAASLGDYFPIGAAIEPAQTGGLKAELLKKHVNMLVAENVMKMDAIQPSEGVFRWDNADRIVSFAKENGMALRFHTLVWHSQVGAWFFKDAEGQPMIDETDPDKMERNKELLLQRLDTHVTAIVERYKDDIRDWDVVNEVIEPGDPDGMRASEWYKITGTDFIATAFRAAREAGGPEIRLYINDYGTDNPVKRDRLYELVKELLEQDVPIDGVGHQTHIDVYGPTVNSIIDSMVKFADLGLDNQVTELDMSLYRWNDRSDYGNQVPESVLELQADRYGELFEAFKANKDILSAVVLWGISDDHTWLNGFPVTRTNAPLLFDRQYQAKSAFWAIVDPSKREAARTEAP
ncbi:endo-1,4-beta-xylanase [Paenibacillus sp. CAU 1782]